MIIIKNYDLFVDERTSKNNKTYYGLFIKVADKEQLLTFINKNVYDTLKDLSK